MAKSILIENIAGGISKSALAKVGLGESINMYPELQQDDQAKTTSILMRTIPGEVKVADIQGVCRGMYRVSKGYDNKPVLYAVYNDKLYLISSTNEVFEIATIPTWGTECNMTETGGYGSAHPHLIIVDGTNVYAVDTGLSIGDQQADFRIIETPLKVNSTDIHIHPTHCAYLYGYLIVNDAATDAFYTSYQYPFEIEDSEPETFYQQRTQFINWWTTLTPAEQESYKAGEIQDTYYTEWKDFIEGTADDTPEKYDLFRVNTIQFAKYGFITYSEWCPDNTLALCSNGSKLYTFGERSWQVFSYNDDKNNPFSSPDNAAGNIGIKAPNSLAMLGNSVLWLGSSDIGDNGVFLIKDTELRRVSTQDIEREISSLKNPENAYSSIWKEHQHTFYSLTFEDDNKTYVYDIDEDAWHYRASYNEVNKLTYWRYNHITFAYSKQYCATNNALCVMEEQHTFCEHDGRPILKLRRGGALVTDNRPFFIDQLRVICNQGQQSFDNHYSNMELNPRISMRYSWDGSTFSDYEDSFLGKIGEYEYDTTFYGCGFGRYFTLEISSSENIPLVLENVQINITPMSTF